MGEGGNIKVGSGNHATESETRVDRVSACKRYNCGSGLKRDLRRNNWCHVWLKMVALTVGLK